MSRPHATGVDVYADMAHPIRRRVIALLARGERSVGQMAPEFSITLPAFSQHLRVLRLANVVKNRRVGRRLLYRLNPAPLRESQRWIGRQVER